MTDDTTLELIPDQDQVSHKTFEDQSDYDAFWQRLLDSVEPTLEKLAEARRQSEEAAKRHHVR